MVNDEIWEKIKYIKEEIDLYEKSVEKIKKRIINLEKRKQIMNDMLPGLWEEFNELYKEYNDKELKNSSHKSDE